MLPGPGYGLSLVLNLQRGDYGSITEAAGARLFLEIMKSIIFRVVIHSRHNPPLVDNQGLMVEPNTATDIAIEHVSVSLKWESRHINI